MADIILPNNENITEATVVQENGSRNSALMTANVGTTNLILPEKENVDKAIYIDDDGKRHRVQLVAAIYGGGSGGDAHNKGYFATPTALRTAHPTAQDGDYAVVGSTDTIWVWDSDTTDWKDTDTKGEVESVNGKIGVVVLNADDVSAVEQVNALPTASASTVGKIVQYKGATTSSLTNGYFYKGNSTSNYSASISFAENKISISDADYLAFLQAEFPDIFPNIVSGKMVYDNTDSADIWKFIGYNANSEVITKKWDGIQYKDFQQYTDDYEEAGFAFNYEYQDQDEVTFTNTITGSTTYDWENVKVQEENVYTAGTGISITNNVIANTGLVNQGTGTDSVGIEGTASGNKSIAIKGTATGSNGIAIGYSSQSAVNSDNISIGSYSNSSNAGIALGYNTAAINGTYPVAIGYNAQAKGNYVIQLGWGTNTKANTFCVGLSNSNNYRLLESDGTIPNARLTDDTPADGEVLTYDSTSSKAVWASPAKTPSTMPELTVAGWINSTQTVSVAGVTANNVVFVAPAPASASAYTQAGIICTAQGAGVLTFTCTTTPTAAITVNVVIL